MKHTALWIALCIFIAIACLELGVILFLAQDDVMRGQIIKVMERQAVLSGRVAALEGKQEKSRSHKSEVRSQKSEVRDQKAEVRSQKSEVSK